MIEKDSLPAGWACARIGNIIPKARPKVGADPESDLPFIGMDHIEPETFHLVGQSRYADMKSAGSYFQPNDVLYGRLRPYLNKVHRAKVEGVASAEFIVLPASEYHNSDFIKYLLHQRIFVNYAMSRSSGDRPRVKFEGLAEFKFLLPPLPEQERIVEKIETLFAEIDKGEEALREVQKLLARYRQSVLKAAVTGTLAADWRKANGKPTETGQDLLARILKLRRETGQGRGKYKEPEEPKTDGLPELPEGWAWASVEQLATVIGGLTKNKKRGELPLRRPMLRVANVYQDRLELDNVHETGVSEIELKRVALRKQDILVVEGNGSKDQIGRMALWNCEVPNAVHQNHLIKIRMHHPTIVAFAMRWFQSPQGRQNTESVASSSSGLHTLSISKINRLVVPIPNVGEIEEICERLDDAFAKIGHAEDWSATELKRCKALRQSILKDAFSGKLVPQDSSDEPAEKLLERIRASRAAAARPTRKKIKA